MIRLEKLSIRKFRGILGLDLQLDGKNFAIEGPNGAGKSGVVDAIEFVLTGSISRLTGPGTGGLTAMRHGPHVDYRDNPRESKVSLTAKVVATGAEVSIVRSLDKPRVPRISPDDAVTRGVFEQLARHPEFVLSRREIIKYILVEPGKRASEIQSLLKLERVDRFRSALKTASNTATRAQATAENSQRTAREALKRALDLGAITKEAVLIEVNKLRSAAGLDPLKDLNPSIHVDEGVRTDEKPRRETLSRKILVGDLKATRDLYSDSRPATLVATVTEFTHAHAQLLADPSLLKDVESQQFLEQGLLRFDGKGCPFCGTAWNEEELRELVQRALARLTAGRALASRLLTLGRGLSGYAQTIERPLKALAGAAATMKLEAEHTTLADFVADLGSLQHALSSSTEMITLQAPALGTLLTPPANVETALSKLAIAVEALPSGPSPAEAKASLVEVQLRLEEARKADRDVRQARLQAERGQLGLKSFDETVEEYLNTLYEQVEGRFTSHYQLVNADDESGFSAQIQHQAGSVGLDVDFYGRGLFPPAAYHSEGHQDGMGLCLYLALMQQVLGKAFTFAVLDDVVMSVDSSHRKEVCRLLKERFPTTQFIITTHDKLWLAQMRSAGLVGAKSAINFNRWTVDHGPFVSEAKEAWEKISERLASNDVQEAAAILRRHLEGLAYDLADRFAVEMPLRSDGAYELGELLPRVVGRWNGLLGEAAAAAQSWGDDDAHRLAVERRTALSAAARASNVEQWAINKAVHYNEWANFTEEDFQPVVDAFKALLATFQCGACRSWFYLEPQRRKPETVRCDCGRSPLNLVPKPRA